MAGPIVARRSGQTDDSESAPLLTKADHSHDDADRPLPTGQMALLMLARFIEPVAFFSIFPFVSQMVFETGIPAGQCGFWVGLIESLFSFVQFLIMPLWGKLSDKRGRKGILVVSMFGISMTTVLFGLSRNVYQMIFFRCLSGLFAGSTVTIRTCIAEISTPKTQAIAFSWFAFSGNAAIFVAPLMGGFLVQPAENFEFLRHVKLLQNFPYLLPCVIGGMLALTAATMNLFFLKETLKQKKDESGARVHDDPMSTKELLASDGVRTVLFLNVYTFTLAFGFTALLPVYAFTPISLGGLGLAPRQISLYMGIGGFFQTVWTLGVFPRLHKRIGNRGMFIWAATLWPINAVLYCIVNALLRHGIPRWTFWIMAAVLSIAGTSICMSYTSVQLAVNAVVPRPNALGQLNGLALSLSAATRSVAPAAISSIYAFGVDRQILNGYLAWSVIAVLGLGYNYVVRQLPQMAWGLSRQ